MSDEKLVQVTRHGDVTVVHPGTTINERVRILEFTDELIKFIEDEKPAKLQINFEYVEYFSSEAISALIRAQHRINDNGGRMNLCCMSKDLRRLLKVCGLDGSVFQIYDTASDATAAFQA